MTQQSGVPAAGIGVAMDGDGDHPDDVEPDRGPLRGDDGEPIGRFDRDADLRGTGEPAPREPAPREPAVDEDELDPFLGDDRPETD
jgi:hypothetical protein